MKISSKNKRFLSLKYYLSIFIFIFWSFTVTKNVFSAPITFITALPVAKLEGIIRLQLKYMRSTDDFSSSGRKLNVWAFPVVVVYGASGKLAIFGIFPVLGKNLDVSTPMNGQTRSASGLGDVTFMARYTAWKWDRKGQTIRLAPFVAMEVPTGPTNREDQHGRLPRPLQPGSGSWDPSAGLVFTLQTLQWQIDASTSYKINTEFENFQFGDIARFDFSYQYRIWPKHLGSGIPGFLYAVLESNLIRQGKNKVDGIDDKDSGGITLHLAPGIQYVTKRFVVEVAIQVPVVQNLNGNALKNDFIGTLSMRLNF